MDIPGTPDHVAAGNTIVTLINPLTGTLKPQSTGPLYRNTVINTLAVDGWAVRLQLVQRGGAWAGAAPTSPILAVPNVTAHPSTASVPTSYYSVWHYIASEF